MVATNQKEIENKSTVGILIEIYFKEKGNLKLICHRSFCVYLFSFSLELISQTCLYSNVLNGIISGHLHVQIRQICLRQSFEYYAK